MVDHLTEVAATHMAWNSDRRICNSVPTQEQSNIYILKHTYTKLVSVRLLLLLCEELNTDLACRLLLVFGRCVHLKKLSRES